MSSLCFSDKLRIPMCSVLYIGVIILMQLPSDIHVVVTIRYLVNIKLLTETNFDTTVKPVFKGHCDEGTPCDQGTLSQNGVLSSPC